MFQILYNVKQFNLISLSSTPLPKTLLLTLGLGLAPQNFGDATAQFRRRLIKSHFLMSADSSLLSQPNGVPASLVATLAMPLELEQTLALLSSHRSVLGYMLLSRGQPVSIIRHSGVVFEGEQGRKYASVIGRIIESVQGGLEEVYGNDSDGVSILNFQLDVKI